MKPETKYFPPLKDEGEFVRWKEQFETSATATGLENALDPHYVPRPGHEQDFLNRSRWLYKLLADKCHTPAARAILATHKEDRNGQAAYAGIMREYSTSMSAEIYTDDLLSQITTAKYDHRGSLPSLEFVVELNQMITDYNENLRDPALRIPIAARRLHLHNALKHVKDFADIKQREQ